MITLKNFGVARDITGKPELGLDTEQQKIRTIDDLRTYLFAEYPELADVSSVAFAINEEYARENDVIAEGDTIAIIPPVSGG